MQRINGLTICSRCLRGKPLLKPPKVLARSASTLPVSNPAFASFFSPNQRWTLAHRPFAKATAATLALTPTSLDDPSPSAALAVYKPVPALGARQLLRLYAQLSKARLTNLIVLTAMGGVAVSPLPASVPTLLATALGTALCCASANTLNQLQEVPFDAQMARTRSRPLVRRALTPLHAGTFAVVTGVAGPALLWTMVNPTTAVLGAANIALYAGAYTWLKRKSTFNTWVGAVVGGIPPVMGWTACGGHILPSAEHPFALFPPTFFSSYAPPVDLALVDNPLAPLALFLFLYSWQFPHFNSLSHLVRASYAQAGYRMLAVLDPAKNTAVGLRHAVLMSGVCVALVPLSGLTTWTFALTSLPVHAFFTRAAYKFWRTGSERDARALFYHSLWYLPVVLGLMMVHKQGAEWRKSLGWTTDEEKQEVRLAAAVEA